MVCHGDACAPNTLLYPDGRWSGHVDFGLLGTGDRWADIAVATWSAEWNYGPGWEPLLLDAYGVEPDAERTRYYRLLVGPELVRLRGGTAALRVPARRHTAGTMAA